MARAPAAGILFALLALPLGDSPAAADGTVIITQAKALKGGIITPFDEPGYPISLDHNTNYRLGSDLRVTANKDAFVDTYSGEIDLGGFTVSGGGTANHFMAGEIGQITIRNGTITGFKSTAIENDLLEFEASYWTIEDVTFTNNGGVITDYAERPGRFFEFRNNIVISNKGGVLCGNYCHVEGNLFANNGTAIALYSGTVLGNTIIDNSYGIYAIKYSDYAEGIVGYGNNTIMNNGTQVTNDPVPLAPNACTPAC